MNFWVDSALDEAEDLVMTYHYSRRMPSNIQCIVTAHENGGLFGDRGRAIAACIFSIPPTRWSEEVWELARLVRRDDVLFPLTSMIAEACRIIKKRKSIDLLVSFADSTQGHHGGIYQAASWKFDGQRESAVCGVNIGGEYIPGRSANSRFGTRSTTALKERFGIDATDVWDTGKYLYWRSLLKSGKQKASRIGLKDLPYPKPNHKSVMLP